ncbi:hypothetical protein F5H01DRAFT_124068 [Linnemannia elongata]|nr:hypothetical protein F5H01DRAFT_124068 [Linnemannia elongata]
MTFEIYGPDPTVLDKSGRKPHVLIIGAGLAGLTLGIMLQKASIPFDIFEKSPEAGAVGSALFLAPQVCPILQDLGILDQYLDHSNPCTSIHFFNQDRQPDFQLDFLLYNDLTGCEGRIIPHATLHALLLSQIPSSRIHTSKRLLWFTQGENGVQVRFSDSKTFDGDILVGADGPTSAVRQCLYESLRKRNKLARKDQCRFYNTRSNDQPYSWNTMTCKDGSISWSITQHSPPSSPPCTSASTTPSSTSFPSPLSNLDWSIDGVAVESIITQIRAFPIPCPFQTNTNTSSSNSNTSSSHDNDKTKVTLGDLIDKTSRDKMAKVVVEERMFDTWYYCRTVLIGDACHKVSCHNCIISSTSEEIIQQKQKHAQLTSSYLI